MTNPHNHQRNTTPLQVVSLEKQFGKTKAVCGISFSLEKGEVLGVVGPNGAGKTTTIKLILGLLQQDRGEISLFGSTIQDPAVKQKIGYMPETPHFYNHLTGRELLIFAGELFGLKGLSLKARVRELLSLVGLEKAANRQLLGYSKGMLQRIGLAQALVNKPELLFLDEPMDGLDPIGRIEMKEILLQIRAEGTAIIFNSHILADVAAISDKIAIMNQGELLKLEPVNQLIPKGKSLEDVFIEVIKVAHTAQKGEQL